MTFHNSEEWKSLVKMLHQGKEKDAEQFSRFMIPKLQGIIITSRDNALPVWAKGYRVDERGMS